MFVSFWLVAGVVYYANRISSSKQGECFEFVCLSGLYLVYKELCYFNPFFFVLINLWGLLA